MSLKHGILGFLSNEDCSGYHLEKLFSSRIGYFWNAKISQVYRDLNSMEKLGWVQSNMVVQSDRPNKKVFKITDSGKKELERWLAEYSTRGDFEIRMGILVRMYFANKLSKDYTIKLLQGFLSDSKQKLAEINAITVDGIENASPLEVIYVESTLEYGKQHYKMQINWCEDILKKIQNVT